MLCPGWACTMNTPGMWNTPLGLWKSIHQHRTAENAGQPGCKKTENKRFLPSLSVYMMENFTPAAIMVHESKSIFPTKAEVTREQVQEQLKEAQQEKNERKPCWHTARCLSNIHHVLPSLPRIIAASIVINTLVDKRKIKPAPIGSVWSPIISMLFVLGEKKIN